MLPNLIIAGAQKSGTTSLYNLFKQHSDFCVSSRSETHFFDRSINFGKGREFYSQHFQARNGCLHIVDNTPSYMFVPEVPKRIHDLLPDARFIFILRDPVKRAWSHYWHEVKKGRERLDFEFAIQKDLKGELNTFDELINQSYVSRGYYYEQIRRFEKLYGRDRLLVLAFEDMVRNKETFFKSISDFVKCDYEQFLNFSLESRNTGFVPRSKSMAYFAHNTTLGRKIPFRNNLLKWGAKPVPKLTDEKIISGLKGIFVPHNETLAKEYDLDLSAWSH